MKPNQNSPLLETGAQSSPTHAPSPSPPSPLLSLFSPLSASYDPCSEILPFPDLTDLLNEDSQSSELSLSSSSIPPLISLPPSAPSYGGSLRVAILNSLKDNEELIVSSQTKHTKNSRGQKKKSSSLSRSSSSSAPSKPQLLMTNMNSLSLWTTSLTELQSSSSSCSSFLTLLPQDLFMTLLCSYLSLIDLSHLRSTSSRCWNLVTQYAFDHSLIPLGQGDYQATCQPIAMLRAKEYQRCGLSRPKWEHDHNAVCQLCQEGQLDVFDCYCHTCNVSYHRVCLTNNRDGEMEEEEGEELLSDPLESPFLCQECREVEETPVSGFTLLLPPRCDTVTTTATQTRNSSTSSSSLSSSSLSLAPSPVDVSRSHSHSPTETNSSLELQPHPVRGSLRVALRNSLLDSHQVDSHSSTVASSHRERERTPHCNSRIPIPPMWWEHSERGVLRRDPPSISFRVVGGFNSSNMAPSGGIYEFSSGAPTAPSSSRHLPPRSEPTWRFCPYDHLPSHLPTLHSNMSLVISPDRLDEQLTQPPCRVWAFPQLRDRPVVITSSSTSVPTARAPSEPFLKRDICFDVACLLAVPSSSTEPWSWRDQELDGEVPAPRVGSAFCYSHFLGAIIVHGGLTRESRPLSSAPSSSPLLPLPPLSPEESFDDWATQPPTPLGVGTAVSGGTAYLATDSLHCLPIRDDLSLSLSSLCPSASATASSKMTTRQTNVTEKRETAIGSSSLELHTWTNLTHHLAPGVGVPSARHGHTITAIGSQLWVFGGMGFESSESWGRGPKKRRQLNDLYLLEVGALRQEPSSTSAAQRRLEWILPASRGPVPPRRAGHSALAMGAQLIICGGANGSRYLSDLYILHTPTVTWSSVQLLSSPALSPSLLPTLLPPPRPLSWAEVISKRIKPALLPVSHDQLLIFGGGLVCDFSAPLYGAIPADCYLVTLKLSTRPKTKAPPVATGSCSSDDSHEHTTTASRAPPRKRKRAVGRPRNK
jgi:hypothetical protein